MKNIVFLLMLIIGVNALAFDNEGIMNYKTMLHNDIIKRCNEPSNINIYANIIIGNVRTYTPYISYSELNKNNILSELAYKKAPEYCINYWMKLMEFETKANFFYNKSYPFELKNLIKKDDKYLAKENNSFAIVIIFGIVVIIGVFLYYRRIINDSKSS